MHEHTKELLTKCAEAEHICADAVATELQTFVQVINKALQEVSILRMQYAMMQAHEDDAKLKGQLYQVNQKLGAIERDGRALSDLGIKVVAIFKEFEDMAKKLEGLTSEPS